MYRSLAIAALTLALSAPLKAVAGSAEFDQAYNAYQQAVNAKDLQSALTHAREAYRLGADLFGVDSVDYANLGINLAKQLPPNEQEKAASLLKQALKSYKKAYGKESDKLLEIYARLIETDFDHRKSHLNAMLALGEEVYEKDSLAYANLMLEASRICMRDSQLARKGRSLAGDALEIIKEKAPRETLERVEAEYVNALWAQGFSEDEAAIEHFGTVIELLEDLEYSHPYALAAHSRLVPLLEQSGRSDDATAHCLAIAQMKPWDNNQEQKPLFRQEPRWTKSAIQRGKNGSVVLDITIDKQGFVTDMKVLESEGHKDFVRETKKAVKKWRYAPKFQDGQPVTANTQVKMEFLVRKG
ncbi:energy transducer TonB [Ferrimonas futtsuensis]|uniref:energy transducer TonB n=1 Tax=Ferrimonas futtsuensis TaxID=364764 RepID=UPI00041A256D|nr:energy transducer TonB [Ferrimonas futtsuensis]